MVRVVKKKKEQTEYLINMLGYVVKAIGNLSCFMIFVTIRFIS